MKVQVGVAALILSMAPAFALEGEAEIKGRVHYSFNSGRHVVETERGELIHVFTSKLSQERREVLERASVSGAWVEMDVPVGALEFQSADSAQEPESRSEMGESLVWLDAKSIVVKGSKGMSWDDSHFIILAGDMAFRLSRAELFDAQTERLELAAVGDRVQLSVPVAAVDGTWALLSPEREIPMNDETDYFIVSGDRIALSGAVVWSSMDGRGAIQNADLIVMFDRASVAGNQSTLDRPGTRARVSIPQSAITAMWNIPAGPPPAVRSPAGVNVP